MSFTSWLGQQISAPGKWVAGKYDQAKASVAQKYLNFLDNKGIAKAKELAAQAAKQTPEQKQAAFNEAYKSMTGDFDAQPINQPATACPATGKAARRAQRLDLIRRGQNSAATMPAGPGKTAVTNAASRLRRDMDQVEYARASEEVYLSNQDTSAMPAGLSAIAKSAPEGMLPATGDDLDKLNLTPDDLAPPNSDFRAAVYKLDPSVWGPENDGKYVVAFRGSTTAEDDWTNNMRQGANQDSSYYRQAVKIGQEIQGSGEGDNVHLAGHSLGGGLASAASGAGGLLASTFNSAGLNSHTVARYTGNPDAVADPEKILAYRIKGEVLTKTQEQDWTTKFIAPHAVGTKVNLDPPAPGISSDDLHGITKVIGSMENQKKADETTLQQATTPSSSR